MYHGRGRFRLPPFGGLNRPQVKPKTLGEPYRRLDSQDTRETGKTTFARQFVPLLHPGVPFLNADEIQGESAAFASAASAARELITRLDAAELVAKSFTVETTLASRSYVSRLRWWKSLGFRTVLHLSSFRPRTSPSSVFGPALQPVGTTFLRRTSAGGSTVVGGYFLSYTEMRSTFHTIGSVMKTASDSSASVQSPEVDELALLLEAARRANWDGAHGPSHLRSGRFFISANMNAHASHRLASRESEAEQPMPARKTHGR